MSKLVASIKEAIEQCGLKDGMTISFHHHMRNGDYVLNMVMEAIAEMGLSSTIRIRADIKLWRICALIMPSLFRVKKQASVQKPPEMALKTA